MNLKYIQEKLNEMFETDSRQLVFWYDDNAEFCEEIKDLKLDNAQIYQLKKDNWLHTKYFLEIEDTKNNYLIYAPFPRPDDKDNYLADMVYYATPFCADKIAIISQELNVPNKCRSVLKKYTKFWNADSRVNSFKDLNIKKYSEENIKIAILCVLAKVRIANFDELLKKILTDNNFNESKYLTKFKKMGILDTFWNLCEEKYGYFDSIPSIEKFLISLLITYTSTRFKGDMPKPWENLLSEKQNDIGVFINNLMSNVNYKDEYDNVAAEIAKKINLESHLKRIPPENYYNCDAFEIFDKKIIEHLTDLLISNQEELPVILKLLAERQKTHFYYKYADHYTAIKWANCLIRCVNEFSNEDRPTTANEIIDIYCNKWSFIDRSYREFYYAYDKIGNKDKIQDLRQLIENMYTNTYLSKLAMSWSDKLEKYDSINDLSVNKQYNFYKDNVKLSVKKQKTAVIISDAFRYECGNELKDELNKDPTRTAEIEPMISTVPSYTALGMASLLPHKEIKFDKNYKKVLVDNKPSASTDERQRILENYHQDAIASNYDELMSLNMASLREKLKNKDLIYIYHNQIDARGDNSSTENEVFSASNEAIAEIIRLVTKLTNEASVKNYWITADHGFIYKRDKLDESDKVDLLKEQIYVKNKRYLLSKDELNLEGASNYALNYLNEDIQVTVPRGVDIFKTPGAGQNYVHGGASLQEIVLPVIHIKSKATSKNQEYVELDLISLNKKITNLNTFLTFAQKENISNKILPLETKLYFEDEDGEKISNEVIIYANKNVESAKDREFREKFTLRNKRYSKSKKYFLVMKNMENDVEINRYEFIIDIAFSDDFMF